MIEKYNTPKDVPQHIVRARKPYVLYDLVQAKHMSRQRILNLNKTLAKGNVPPAFIPVQIEKTVDHHWVAIYEHTPKRTR